MPRRYRRDKPDLGVAAALLQPECPLRHEGDGHSVSAHYAGLRAWIKYIGVKMPSRPASAMATAQRFKVSNTRTVPCGAMWSASSTFSELWVTPRPIRELRKAAREKPEPISGCYQGIEGPAGTARSRVSNTSNPTDRSASSIVCRSSIMSRPPPSSMMSTIMIIGIGGELAAGSTQSRSLEGAREWIR